MKRFATLLFTLLFIITNALTCFATNNLPEQTPASMNDKITIASGAMEATPEEIASAEAEFRPELLTLNLSSNARADWYTVSNITYYGQEKSMSCGPACVRMALKKLTGIQYYEPTIRANTNYSDSNGTSLFGLVPYLNSEQNAHLYTRYHGSSTSYILNGITSCVTSNAPPICGLREQYAYGFPYNTTIGGHFVIINKIATDQSAVGIYDPWAGYKGDSANQSYTVSATNLMNAYCLVACGIAF